MFTVLLYLKSWTVQLQCWSLICIHVVCECNNLRLRGASTSLSTRHLATALAAFRTRRTIHFPPTRYSDDIAISIPRRRTPPESGVAFLEKPRLLRKIP